MAKNLQVSRQARETPAASVITPLLAVIDLDMQDSTSVNFNPRIPQIIDKLLDGGTSLSDPIVLNFS